MKAILIATVLLTKVARIYVCAPVLSDILCLWEPRIPNNNLVIKYSHKSTQEFSEADCITSLIHTAQNTLHA